MINNKKILSVITARGDSKGIKNKNVRELMGKPLFMWSVLASLNSKYIDMTAVSSNCSKVHKILNKFTEPMINRRVDEHMRKEAYSDTIPFYVQRPEEISGDLSINEEALIHAVNFYKDRDKKEFDIILNLQPTSPVRLNSLIDKSIEAYINGEHDSLLTASEVTPFLWQKIKGKWDYIDRNFSFAYVKKPYQSSEQYQLIKSFDDCCERKMRQEIESENKLLYHDNGNIYLTDTKVLMNNKCRIGKNPIVFPIDKLNSLQIDTEFDFKLIENMIKSYNLENLY